MVENPVPQCECTMILIVWLFYIPSPLLVTPPLCLTRPVAVRWYISWHLAAWGIPLPYKIHLLAVQRTRTQTVRKKLCRSAIHRQNLAKTRFSPTDKCYNHFNQPCQRLYNYWTRGMMCFGAGVQSFLHHSQACRTMPWLLTTQVFHHYSATHS